MYICNCLGIRETEVKKAIMAGIDKWDQVHAHYNSTPCCGKCEEDIKKMMEYYSSNITQIV